MASRSTLLGAVAAGCAALAFAAAPEAARERDGGANGTVAAKLEFAPSGVCGRGATMPRLPRGAGQALLAAVGAEGDLLPPPLHAGLGKGTFPVTTRVPEAQAYVDQGLKLAYGFNHAEAVRSFRRAQALDPDCAACFWGEALALGTNINAPMIPAAIPPALAATEAAKRLAAAASEKERLLVDAVAVRYAPLARGEAAADEAGYARRMAEAHARYPEDDTVAVLYVESLMNLQPWDYWQADHRTPKGQAGEALAAVERVLARNPDHPQAIHLHIHLTEASADPERAEPQADRLGELAPGLGHLVHMPSHTYYRLGRWQDSLQANLKAIEVDRAFLAANPGSPMYSYLYRPHNIHFGLTSAQMAGDRGTAMRLAAELPGTLSPEVTAAAPFVQTIMAGPYFAVAQLGTPAEALALPDPGERFALVRVAWRYARAAAALRAGDLAGAETEATALANVAGQDALAALEPAGVPGPGLAAIARLAVEARIARAKGETARAIEAYEAAVAIQDGLAYMEPPYWYYPVRQSLGAALLEAGRPAEAALVLEASLIEAPNNGWALWALADAKRRLGDEAGANATDALFRRAWAGPSELLALERL